MWLKCIGVVSGCCKELYRFHHITYPYFLFILKVFFHFWFMLFLCNIAKVAQKHSRLFKNQDHADMAI